MAENRWLTLVLAVTLAGCAASRSVDDSRLLTPPVERSRRSAYERVLNETPDPAQLRAYHDLFGSVPHIAGTPGDDRVVERLVQVFEGLGLEVEQHDIWVHLARPVAAEVEIVAPVTMTLPIQERFLPGDPDTGHPDLPFGFNAYSGSGEATGEVVYANYGRKEDFAQLRSLGVDLTGRIVIVRYGGNYRGYKAKFAEDSGAAGVILYTDPADSGFVKGPPYPEGGFANETSIQRGSIKTIPYPGDPLTPFEPATEDAERLDPRDVALPTIPVQPVGWGAAREILSRMDGRELPGELPKWQGGLPLAYRLEGGPDLRVRLAVEQERRVVRTANVLGKLEGTETDEVVVIGCHHDAWGFGAGDPLAGLIVVAEAARSFADAAARGWRPRRSIVFAAWGAEEHGIIGSTEWCEANRAMLSERGVAYINLDMAAMGPNFRSSAAPTLQTVITDATRVVPQAGGAAGETVHDAWTKGGIRAPGFGNLGGGSDHVGFYCHLGIPSCSLGAGGSAGTSYHSNYDTLRWYRQVVGDDYEPARMLTRMTNVLAARLADATLLPLDPTRYPAEMLRHLDAIEARADTLEIEVDLSRLRRATRMHLEWIEETWARLIDRADAADLTPEDIQRINAELLVMERAWLEPPGLAGRPWFRNLYAATEPDSGYAAWMLPALRGAVEAGDQPAIEAAVARYIAVLEDLDAVRVTLERR